MAWLYAHTECLLAETIAALSSSRDLPSGATLSPHASFNSYDERPSFCDHPFVYEHGYGNTGSDREQQDVRNFELRRWNRIGTCLCSAESLWDAGQWIAVARVLNWCTSWVSGMGQVYEHASRRGPVGSQDPLGVHMTRTSWRQCTRLRPGMVLFIQCTSWCESNACTWMYT